MAADGLQGRTSLGRFFAEGRSNYLHLLLAAFLLMIIIGIIAGVGAIVLVLVGFFAFGISTASVDVGIGTLAVVGILVLLYILVLSAIALLLQFVYQAVVDDVGPVAALRQSYRTVRQSLVGAIGVGLISMLLSVVFVAVPVTIASVAVQTGPSTIDVPLSETAAYAIVYGWGTVSTVVFGAFNNTMLVAFYDAYAPSPV